MNTVSPCLYLLHGMKRSGNHALVNWLVPQLGCDVANNIIPLGPLLRGHPMPPPLTYEEWRRRRGYGPANDQPCLLATLEDHDLRLAPFVQIDVPLRRLLVVRNPRDLFSSRIRKSFRVDMPAYPRADGEVLRRAVGLWKQHARSYLGQEDAWPGRTAILFDAWFRDAGYRAAVAASLRVAFDDRGFGRVTGEGGGSSFDGTRFDGNAAQMRVTDRMASLKPHERQLLDQVFQDPEVRDLDRALGEADPYRQIDCTR